MPRCRSKQKLSSRRRNCRRRRSSYLHRRPMLAMWCACVASGMNGNRPVAPRTPGAAESKALQTQSSFQKPPAQSP
eukprot:1235307-Prymnesium_polylepis.1